MFRLFCFRQDQGLKRDLLQRHWASFALCDAQLEAQLDATKQLNATYEKWKHLQESCRLAKMDGFGHPNKPTNKDTDKQTSKQPNKQTDNQPTNQANK